MPDNNNNSPSARRQLGLLLPGGGARAAYQVGVIKAIAELVEGDATPFDVLCGTSAGAINAVALASRRENFVDSSLWLEQLWLDLNFEHVYRSDFFGVMNNLWRLLRSLFNAGIAIGRPVALLDNTPLRRLLRKRIDFPAITDNIKNDRLSAVCVTAMNYTESMSVSFFQGGPAHAEWNRWRRQGIPTPIQLPHLLASTAIPSIFPPQRIRRNYYGDGALRQMNPVSPALHLGAEKVLIIGTSGHKKTYQHVAKRVHSPAFGQVIGHLLNSAFLDSLDTDIETLEGINGIIDQFPEQEFSFNQRAVKKVEPYVISPSQDIDVIAERHLDELPTVIRQFLKITGSGSGDGSINIGSYLLFAEPFSRELIDLGYKDAMNQASAIRHFIEKP